VTNEENHVSEGQHSDLQPDKRAEQILQDYIDHSGVTLKKQQSDRTYYSPGQDAYILLFCGEQAGNKKRKTLTEHERKKQ
jgi:hypothetical protein